MTTTHSMGSGSGSDAGGRHTIEGCGHRSVSHTHRRARVHTQVWFTHIPTCVHTHALHARVLAHSLFSGTHAYAHKSGSQTHRRVRYTRVAHTRSHTFSFSLHLPTPLSHALTHTHCGHRSSCADCLRQYVSSRIARCVRVCAHARAHVYEGVRMSVRMRARGGAGVALDPSSCYSPVYPLPHNSGDVLPWIPCPAEACSSPLTPNQLSGSSR